MDLKPEPAGSRRELRAALEALSPALRRVLVLHDAGGWSHARIGTELGIPEALCRTRLYAARAELRRILTQRTTTTAFM